MLTDPGVRGYYFEKHHGSLSRQSVTAYLDRIRPDFEQIASFFQGCLHRALIVNKLGVGPGAFPAECLSPDFSERPWIYIGRGMSLCEIEVLALAQESSSICSLSRLAFLLCGQ